jgi:hypothetical protein
VARCAGSVAQGPGRDGDATAVRAGRLRVTALQNTYPIESPEPAARAVGPTIFVRTFTAPPGLPWDQRRVANLEARSGAPLPLTEVVYQLQRLAPWSVGRSARYAAFYVHSRDAVKPFQSTVDVDGRPVRVNFAPPEDARRRVMGLAALASVTAGVALAVSAAVSTAWSVRTETESRLDTLAKVAAAKTRTARELDRQRKLARSLAAEGVGGLQLDVVLADLDWAARARAPDAAIRGFHWDHGHMAVEVRGDGSPFIVNDRTIVRTDKPISGHDWLWGVEPLHATAGGR